MNIGGKVALTASAALAALGTAYFIASKAKSDIKESTFPFAMKDGSVLYLDKYESENILHRHRPVVIFTYGGGFVSGHRNKPQYIEFMNFLAREGFIAIICDYRKSLRHIDPEKGKSSLGMLQAMFEAVEKASDDFIDATAFVLDHADDWGVDTNCIIASGSSAGAITALQTEYNICNGRVKSKKLPENFNYSAVMSFAGAIYDNHPLKWDKKPCPFLLFHGDADGRVPFNKVNFRDLVGLWGSMSIAKSLKSAKSPYYFYIVENEGHAVCKTPLTENQKNVKEFIYHFVKRHKRLIVTTKDHRIKGEGIRKNFGLKDYIYNNVARRRDY